MTPKNAPASELSTLCNALHRSSKVRSNLQSRAHYSLSALLSTFPTTIDAPTDMQMELFEQASDVLVLIVML